MKIYRNLTKGEITNKLKRPTMDNSELERLVTDVILRVRSAGDKALFAYSKEFDNIELENLLISQDDIDNAENQISQELKNAIDVAYNNIFKFHSSQTNEEDIIETMPGVKCWRRSTAIPKVGIYVPGGTAPLFSTILMLGVPAQIAGCSEIIMCTPPQKNQTMNPAMLYAAKKTGVSKIFLVGGAQAVAAMAFGTQTVPKVDKIFGPGNQFVTMAKMLVSTEGVAIDMPAGPSEVMVVADKSANPVFIASDLLSQAEHGVDSQSILLTQNNEIAESVSIEVDKQLEKLPRKEIVGKSIANSKIFVIENKDELIEVMNEYAPEHLILSVMDYQAMSEKIINAGSVFLGNYTPESAGDYASGTNHTLPTNGYAKAFSGVSVDSFVKKITFQEISPQGLKNIGQTIEVMAAAEELEAHKNAVSLRLKSL